VEEEGMAEAAEGEATAVVEAAAVAAEGMIGVTTADRTETGDRHPSRKVNRWTARSPPSASEYME